MSDKTRIHELAKSYGMPGKDLASKLRENGFVQARSHMSALDSIELLQAKGLLAAIGITEVRTDTAPVKAKVTENATPLLRRKKKKASTNAPADEAPNAPSAGPEVQTAPEPAQAEVTSSPAPESEAEVSTPPEPEARPEEPASEQEPAPTPVPAAEEPTTDPADAGSGDDSPQTAPPVEAPTAKSAEPQPRGKIVGRIDPATLAAQAEPQRKREGRRLLNQDDATPDVHPTFGRGKGTPGQTTGPRGGMTATQLREREQGRFLRRNRQSGVQGQRRTGGRGRPALVTESPLTGETVSIEMPITMSKLAETLKLKAAVVQKMAMQKQYGMFTLNSAIDEDTAVLLATEYEVELRVQHEVSAEQTHLEDIKAKRSGLEGDDLVNRPPTLAFLGHVDHGKTTLVDKIRATKVADGEAGGITQHIGAYQVTTSNKNSVTIVDTPGHQAFSSMRARGAQAVDVVVLVVAGDDGVKPSTEEAVAHARAAETPIIVAVNKLDKPEYDFNRTVQQLMKFDLTPEDYGGQTAYFQTSGITGEGIEEMLDHAFLMAEAELGLKAHQSGPASGVVLEAEVQQGRGIVAHLLVQDGTLNQGDVILAGEGYGKVKSISSDLNKQVKSAGPSTPVAVMGLDALPGVGDKFHVIEALSKAKEIAQERERRNRASFLAASTGPNPELEAILGKEPLLEKTNINLIVRADVQGSVEVIRHEVAKLDHEEVAVKLVHAGVGQITESDVELAEASGATLVAFHTGIPGTIRKEAERRKIIVRRYDVIYELLDQLRDLMEGTLSPEMQEEIIAHAEVKALFKSSKIGVIAGCGITDGTLKRNHKIRVLRDGTVVHTGSIESLRREKDDAREVREGFECGIVLANFRDLREGDVIEAFVINEIKRTLA
ncbi:MAG: translation initiation factor IF-2 [Planctomycetes bacterium]|nr:translation initiation factor IF-2 [Planctomycetota bacterium]